MLRTSTQPPANDAIALVDSILQIAIARGASDVHVEPGTRGCEIRLRIDGLLDLLETHDLIVGRSLVARLMVMAQLLTYRTDVPQEGRISFAIAGKDRPLDLRVAVMPTTHGLRAAVRLPAELVQPRSLDELNLPQPVLDGLKRFAASDAGMLIVTGPAGSGKTTTIYALLQYIAATSPGLSIVALEDPVERDLPGVTQIEVSNFGQLTYEKALRSILRQDPQVLMLGEIRDAATASLAVQAALSGHRLICTLHAGNSGGAIARLLEMGLEPHQITSSLFGVVAQRLLRRISSVDGVADAVTGSTTPSTEAEELSPQLSRYAGRIPAGEFVSLSEPLRQAILARADATQLQRIAAQQPDYQSLQAAAMRLVDAGATDLAEVQRVLGNFTL